MGKKINLSKQFNKDLKNLSKELKQEFLECVTEFLNWPDLPKGRHLEKIFELPEGVIYSIRITYHIRMLIQVIDNNTLRFITIGPHDEVYKKVK